MPYVISWVASVMMKGCRSNFATENPLMNPIIAQAAIAASSGMMIGRGSRPGKILLAVMDILATMTAASPTMRPAEISVPVRTMHPAMPRAMGSFAAVRLTMLTIEFTER